MILSFFKIAIDQLETVFFLVDLENSKFATFSPIRGSSVLGKPMEYCNVMEFSVHFWEGINSLAVPTSRVFNYLFSFFITQCTRRFTPGFHLTHRVYRRKHIERHNFATLLWNWFCVKILAKCAAKESELLLFANFCATSWDCCSILFLDCFGYFQRKNHHRICTLPC